MGKNRLEKGIAAYKAKHPESTDTFATTWMPFYLNPTAPKTSVDKTAYYKDKFGASKTEAIFSRLAAVGEEDGIAFKFGGRTGGTRDSHRLIQFAKTKGPDTQTKVVEKLFQAYFEEEGDITSHSVLKDAALKAGVSEEDATRVLASDEGGPLVDKEVSNAQTRDIHGVPHFTIQDMFEISGAQEPAAFVQLFERVKTKSKA
ncbi:MAG: hypothetical protein M1828_001770 [Chrysothrix sp. TS-e1954]|nr:MAG: hypothetical protein M1828_001770 [Chrysothrix sp. TS-e1954]